MDIKILNDVKFRGDIVTCDVLGVVQFLYLPWSSVCVIPVNMTKNSIEPTILLYSCYGNRNLQAITTYLHVIEIASFDTTYLRLCGPMMFASVIGIMSDTTMQSSLGVTFIHINCCEYCELVCSVHSGGICAT